MNSNPVNIIGIAHLIISNES